MRRPPQAAQARAASGDGPAAVAAERGHLSPAGHSQAAPRTPEESPCAVAQDRRVDDVAEHVARQQRRAARRRDASMLDMPPPSTMTSGSSRLTTCARPRASRSAWRSSAARAPRIARGGAGRDAGASRAPWPVAVARQRGAGDQVSRQPVLAAPAERARAVRPAAARAADCGPTRRRRGCGRAAPGRRPRCRRRSRCRGSRRTPRRSPRPAPSVASREREAVGVVLDPHLAAEQRRLMSRSNAWPFSAIELAFFTRPVAGLITPGMPMPTVAVSPSSRSASRTRPAMAASVGRDIREAWRSAGAAARRRPAPSTAISILVPPRSMPNAVTYHPASVMPGGPPAQVIRRFNGGQAQPSHVRRGLGARAGTCHDPRPRREDECEFHAGCHCCSAR